MRVQLAVIVALLAGAGCQKAPAQATAGAAAAGGPSQPATAVPAGQAPAVTPGATPVETGRSENAARPAVKPVPPDLPEVLARVNGEAIKRSEFERALYTVETRAGRAVPAEQRDQVYRGVLDQLVTMHLLLQETRTRNMSVTEADIDARIDRLKKQFKTEDEFTKALASRNMTMAALREEARNELVVAKMLEAEVRPKIKIADGDVKDFYDKNPQQFQEPESYRASHVLIRVESGATDAQKREARTKIDMVLKQAREGADFATLAREHSQDGSASNGGDLNYFRKGQMVGPFEQAVMALKVGEISGVVETQFGFHVIKLTDKRAGRIVPLAEASTRIGQFLLLRAQQQKTGEFVQALRARSRIEILI